MATRIYNGDTSRKYFNTNYKKAARAFNAHKGFDGSSIWLEMARAKMQAVKLAAIVCGMSVAALDAYMIGKLGVQPSLKNMGVLTGAMLVVGYVMYAVEKRAALDNYIRHLNRANSSMGNDLFMSLMKTPHLIVDNAPKPRRT